MSFAKFKALIFSDIHRIYGKSSFAIIFKELIFGEAYKFTFWLRMCQFSMESPLLKVSLFPASRLILKHYKIKYGISVPFRTKIESGFFIGHFGGIVINRNSIIGKNCNLSHGVTLGQANRGRYQGHPTLGDNVYIGPGAKIVGGVKIGSNVAIGANCVVTKDIPDNSVVVGIPGKVISDSGSHGYINRTDYKKIPVN